MQLCPLLLIACCVGLALTSPEDELRKGNAEFSRKLYQEISKMKTGQNFIYSPFTIQTLLAMLASADRTGNTQAVREIRNVANLPQNNPNMEQAFQTVLSGMKKSTNDDFKIFDATKFYFAVGYNVEQWFRAIAQNSYYAEIETVNFGDSYNTINNINSWVAKQTDQRIPHFLSQNDIAANTQNVLLNALYLMGKWDRPFTKEENVRRKFYGQNGNSDVVMMVNKQTFGYAETAHAKYLKMELLKIGGGAHVEFVLPHKRDGLGVLEKDSANLLQTSIFSDAKVDLTLPRFTINGDVNLKAVLQNLGLSRIFKWGAELTGLRYPGHPYMVVNDMYQKSHFRVEEWGVTAASVSESETVVDDVQDLEEKVFVADHPFMFKVVVDGIIVYAGRVVNL